jgi:hypothetical protein
MPFRILRRPHAPEMPSMKTIFVLQRVALWLSVLLLAVLTSMALVASSNACRLWHDRKHNFEHWVGYMYAWRENIYSRVQAVVLYPVHAHHHRTIYRHIRFVHIKHSLSA